MTYFHVLVEGHADLPVVQEILQRRFGLVANKDFQVHPHRGKGKLPIYPNNPPAPQLQGLLDLLPAKLRAWVDLPAEHVVVVLVDADQDNCVELKARLVAMYEGLQKKAGTVLFRIAVEEAESWLIADSQAVRTAYPRAKIQKIATLSPDSVVGAWECLAEAIGRKPRDCNPADKHEWAKIIMPHVNLDNPKSPSLRAFVDGIARFVGVAVLAGTNS